MPAPVRLATSPRLQRVLAVLSDGRAHTTREIAEAAQVVAVDTAVRELRGAPNRLPIQRTQRGHIHSYQLAPVARLQVLVQKAAALADLL
jgi:hypothetical protein